MHTDDNELISGVNGLPEEGAFMLGWTAPYGIECARL